MLHGVPVAPAAVEEPLPTQHRTIRQVQPQVLPQVTLGAFPPTARQNGEKQQEYVRQEPVLYFPLRQVRPTLTPSPESRKGTMG